MLKGWLTFTSAVIIAIGKLWMDFGGDAETVQTVVDGTNKLIADAAIWAGLAGVVWGRIRASTPIFRSTPDA